MEAYHWMPRFKGGDSLSVLYIEEMRSRNKDRGGGGDYVRKDEAEPGGPRPRGRGRHRGNRRGRGGTEYEKKGQRYREGSIENNSEAYQYPQHP